MEERGKPLPIETLPRKELEKLQNKRLRCTLRKAYETTLFWHKKFDSLGIKPEDIKNKEDLQKAHIKGLKIDDDDLLFSPYSVFPNYLETVGYTLLTTSGTSKSLPKIIPYTSYDFQRSNEQAYLLLNMLEISKGVKNLNAFGPPPNASGILLWSALTSVDASQYPLMIDVPPEIKIKIIESYKPKHIWMIGNKALELGNYLQKIGKNLVNFGVEKIEISGEPFSRFKKKTEKLCGVEIIDMYASAELSITAFECPCHEGLHVTENRILLSTIDPETKEEKEEGQITATTLYREVDYPGIFLINKEMGDEAKLFKGECACGRNTLRITPPERIDDIFSIETKKFNPRVIENLLYDDKFTGKYIVVKYIDKDTREVKKLQIRTEVKELLPCSSSELLPKVIEAFAQSNPNTYEVLNKLERERKIEVIYKPEKTLYEGIEKYIKKGGKSTVFVEVVI